MSIEVKGSVAWCQTELMSSPVNFDHRILTPRKQIKVMILSSVFIWPHIKLFTTSADTNTILA